MQANISRYMQWLRDTERVHADDYSALWRWSTQHIEDFWASIWAYFDVQSSTPQSMVLERRVMPGARWFPGTQLNFAEHVFRSERSDRAALIAIDESGRADTWPWVRLREQTAALAQHLRDIGVRPGDRVVGYLPNAPEALVGFLASASCGALWSVCNLDVAVPGVLARFDQLEPKVLIAADGTRHGGREHDRSAAIAELQRALPSLVSTIVVPRLVQPMALQDGQFAWSSVTRGPAALEFSRLPFDHPLWVLFSSGTTGAPKGIVHGHGGVLLEQLKFLSFHIDLSAEDRFFWYCSTSWVMWNVLVSALLVGATIIMYDGSPNQPDASRLWRIAAEQGVSVLGVSPAYLQLCAKGGVRPAVDFQLPLLRAIGCTGAPIPLAAYDWVRDHVGPQVPLNSVSGGTDVAGGFVAGCPLLPVYPGENSGRCLGVAAEAWDSTGKPMTDEVGELVVTQPMPSMPLYFWNDPDGHRYHDSYFDAYPGVWRHGDWVTVTARGSVIVHGRSDATLNRQGVRLGSAEIYEAVESLPEIKESLVVGIEEAEGGYWMPLFVQLAEGVALNDALRVRIAVAIRTAASARHVPDEIIAVPGLPHTLTGKRLEVPIKRIVAGTPVNSALNSGAVDRPELLQIFADIGRARAALKVR